MKFRSYILFLIIICNSLNIQANDKAENPKLFKQFQEIFDRVERDYVHQPDKQKMIDGAINGMLTSLDPHSSYYTDEDLEDFINQTKGEFGGIGVEIFPDNGVVKVISPIDELPAAKAGIKAGDYIIGVNGDLVSNIGFNKAVKEMRGNPGTAVELLVMGENEIKPKKVKVIREIVKIKPVRSNIEGQNIAYIRIVTFNENTINELKKSFKKLESEIKNHNKSISGIILDLRNNPGGLLDQAVSVSEYFIESGVIVTTKGKSPKSVSSLSASKFSTKAPNVPMVVLINSGSASASEIVAGALQDHGRALVIGTKSFGKGSVQTFMQINSRAAVKITTAKYYTPSGRSIQAEGIEPDIIIEPAKVEFANKKDDHIKFSEASLKNYLKNDDEKTNQSEETVKAIENKSGSNLKDLEKVASDKPKNLIEEPSDMYKKDYQFARAYDLVRALILSKNKKSNIEK